MKFELSRPMLKVRGLSIEHHSSTICIDLSVYVHVVYKRLVSKKTCIIIVSLLCTMQELGNEAK